MRRAIADAHFQLGEAAAGDRLYREWLDADPSWGWGWIGWSVAHGLFAAPGHGPPDFALAAEILERGAAVDELGDREDLLERLADVYDELGRSEHARRVRRELRELEWASLADRPYRASRRSRGWVRTRRSRWQRPSRPRRAERGTSNPCGVWESQLPALDPEDAERRARLRRVRSGTGRMGSAPPGDPVGASGRQRMAVQPKTYLTADEYLALERRSPGKAAG